MDRSKETIVRHFPVSGERRRNGLIVHAGGWPIRIRIHRGKSNDQVRLEISAACQLRLTREEDTVP